MAKKPAAQSARHVAESFLLHPLLAQPQPSPWFVFRDPHPLLVQPEPSPWFVFRDPQPSPWIVRLGSGAVKELKRIRLQHDKDVRALQAKALDRAVGVINKAAR
jgi:hypothetical protein